LGVPLNCMGRHLVFASAALVALSSPSSAAQTNKLQPISAVLTALESTDFQVAKIGFDQVIDPSIDPALIESQISRLAQEARRIAGPGASDGAKIDAVRKVLYEAGPWNDNRPFTYDQSDPLGENIRNKLLSVYLKTRLGNCVTMPTLFMIVGRRLGLNLTLSTAPLHVLVRYTRPGTHPFNIEATSSGSFARDEWYIKKFPMSDRAIQSGLYLTSVRRNEEALQIAGAILAADPRNGYAMVRKGSVIAAMMQAEFYDKYPTPNLIPPSLRLRYTTLAAANAKAFADAEALGWEPSLQ
jgi:hypothetical protein